MGFENLEARQLMAADMVVQWNEQLLDAIRIVKPAPPIASRAMAIVHTSMFDAINSIYNKYQPYATMAAVHPKASAEAAVASAAERTLSSLFPSLQSTFAAALTSSLATVPDGIREDQGVAAGQFVADAILALRASDGATTVVSYTPGTNPGDWIPTPPAFAAPVLPQWPFVDIWAMDSGDQFRPLAPPELNSDPYAVDYNMVKDLGSLSSTTRTADQTEIAKIWAGGPGTATPPGQWNMIAQDLAESQGNSLYENARMFAVLNISLADAAISAWDAKYEYDLWRPITAIQQGDLDGNAATLKDASWTPLLTTPAFPSYTSGHSTFSGAASTALAGFFGTDSLNFKLVSEVPGISTRYFSSLASAASEAGISRIYGGIHYNFDNLEALAAGQSIGNLVTKSQLQMQTKVVAQLNEHQLYILGTTLDDNIFSVRTGSNLVVRNHGQLVGQFSTSGLWNVVVNGSSGNDRIEFTHNVATTTELFGGSGNDWLFGTNHRNWLYGESGNDTLFGGGDLDVLVGAAGNDWLHGLSGNDTLVGGDGDDWLYGHAGRDLLFGGRGRDGLFGGLDDDLLIGGHTSYDANAPALTALSAEWSSARSYDERASSLFNGTGPNLAGSGMHLLEGATVFDDGERDYLYGELGRDLFFADSIDRYWDRRPDEILK